ncbi:hypothetical protein HY496_02160 [Candidatus Woesearchaeota archaeon]|nr:hypothetical protein [Candidatus Woesearchaeota archaeon]
MALKQTMKTGKNEKTQEKILFFDAGPIITLVMSRLAWILPELKKKWGGRFYITPAVQYELIDRPLTVKRFEFEALQVLKMMREGVLERFEAVPRQKVNSLITLANTSFRLEDREMDVIQEGEMESASSALEVGAEGVVMDERTLRLFIENNRNMKALLERRFKKQVIPNFQKMDQFSSSLRQLTIIRSIELVGVAYSFGMLDGYIPEGKRGREQLLDAVLWNVKYNGCAVTEQEINDLKQFLLEK